MTLPPITAQIIDIPTAITDLGAVAIIALALLGVVYAIRPLIVGFVDGQKQLAAVNRELLLALTTSDRAIDRGAVFVSQVEMVRILRDSYSNNRNGKKP